MKRKAIIEKDEKVKRNEDGRGVITEHENEDIEVSTLNIFSGSNPRGFLIYERSFNA